MVLVKFYEFKLIVPFQRNYLSLPPRSLSLFLPPLQTIFSFQTTCAQGALSELLRQTNVVFVVCEGEWISRQRDQRAVAFIRCVVLASETAN